MKKMALFLTKVIAGVYAIWFLGAMFDFSFFPADNPVIRAVAYCTVIICIVIAGGIYKVCERIDYYFSAKTNNGEEK